MELKKIRVLVVEDEKGIRDYLKRTLFKAGIEVKNVRGASNSMESIDYIDEFEPNIILLDLNIPKILSGVPDISNAFEVLEKVQFYNGVNRRKIKILVISGTIHDNAIQKIITLSEKIILKYVDKSGIAEDPDAFSEELKESIINVASAKEKQPTIDYKFIRDGELRKLKEDDMELWDFVRQNLIEEFAKIYSSKSNEELIAENIIKSCGKIIETIFSRVYSLQLSQIQRMKLKDRNISIKEKLTFLTGRIYSSSYNGEKVITQATAKYSSLVWDMRNDVTHENINMDKKTKKVFENTKPKIEDAAISMNLIVPLIRDYINFKKERKEKSDQSGHLSPGKR